METPAPAEELAPEDIPPRPLRHHLALTFYWLGNSLMWGALLHVGLASRLVGWFGEDRMGFYYALLGAIGGIVGTVVQIVAGAFSDRLLHRWGRRRPFLAVGSALAAGCLVLLGGATSFWPFLGAMVLMQLFSNMALGPFTALLPDTVNPREHGKASGFMGIARLLGDVGGLVLAGHLLSAAALGDADPARIARFQDQRMFMMCAIMAGFLLVTMAFTCVTIRERPLKARPEATPWQIIRGSFDVDIRGNPDFFWLSVSRAVTNIGFYMFLEVLIPFIKYSLNDPDPEGTTMRIMLPAIGAAALSSIPCGILSDKVGRRRLIFVSQFLMAAGATGFMLAPRLWVAYVAGLPAGLAYGVFTAVEWALACNLLPKGEAARYLGVWNASAVVPQILGFVIAGTVGSGLAALGQGIGWRVDFGIAVACCLGGAYFLKHVREHTRPGAEAECPPALGH